MQSKHSITIVHIMAGMCGMYKLYVHYLEHRRWAHVGSIVCYFQCEHGGRALNKVYLASNNYHKRHKNTPEIEILEKLPETTNSQ